MKRVCLIADKIRLNLKPKEQSWAEKSFDYAFIAYFDLVSAKTQGLSK